MTMKEKARAYDMALESIKKLYSKGSRVVVSKEEFETIFSELKESEDERIRKEIIAFIKRRDRSGCDYDYDKWIAWLEKQGEHKNKINSYKITFEDVLALECAVKTVKITKGGDELYKILVSLYNKIHNAYLAEKQSEQKPMDEDEPKFKVGDWIVWQDKYYKVNDNYCRYLLVDQNELSTSLEYGTVDNSAHLWTIQDAKDGDVLTCNEEILLFKSYSVQGRISLYCWYNGQTNNFHSKEVTDASLTTRNKICPATKEQRELLFSKMKDAGYEFDFEKKELRKIDQKSYGQMEKCIHCQFNYTGYCNGTCILKNNVQKTTVWSEEDDVMLDDCIYFIEKEPTRETHSCVEWLKSIKQRMEE